MGIGTLRRHSGYATRQVVNEPTRADLQAELAAARAEMSRLENELADARAAKATAVPAASVAPGASAEEPAAVAEPATDAAPAAADAEAPKKRRGR